MLACRFRPGCLHLRGGTLWRPLSASPRPHPSKPHPCNMPQAKTEVALQSLECCAAEVALQHWLFCSADVILTKSCAAASEKLQCNILKKLRCTKVALSCRFPADFRLPRLGPADSSALLCTRVRTPLPPLSFMPFCIRPRLKRPCLAMSEMLGDPKEHMNFCNMNFLGPTQKNSILGPQKKFDVPHFLGKDATKGPT